MKMIIALILSLFISVQTFAQNQWVDPDARFSFYVGNAPLGAYHWDIATNQWISGLGPTNPPSHFIVLNIRPTTWDYNPYPPQTDPHWFFGRNILGYGPTTSTEECFGRTYWTANWAADINTFIQEYVAGVQMPVQRFVGGVAQPSWSTSMHVLLIDGVVSGAQLFVDHGTGCPPFPPNGIPDNTGHEMGFTFVSTPNTLTLTDPLSINEQNFMNETRTLQQLRSGSQNMVSTSAVFAWQNYTDGQHSTFNMRWYGPGLWIFDLDMICLQMTSTNPVNWRGHYLVNVRRWGDFNRDSAINTLDIFSYLSAWFASEADADGNGDRCCDVQDVFLFLSDWFTGV